MNLTSLLGGLLVKVRGILGEGLDRFLFGGMGEKVNLFFLVDDRVVDFYE